MLFTGVFESYKSGLSLDRQSLERRITVALQIEDSLAQLEIGDDVVICSKFNFDAIKSAKYLAKVSCDLTNSGAAQNDAASTFSDGLLSGSATYIAPNQDEGLQATLVFSVGLEAKEFDRVYDCLVRDDLKFAIDINLADVEFGWRPDGSDLKWSLAPDDQGWDRKTVSSADIFFTKKESSEINFIHPDTARQMTANSQKLSQENMNLALLDLILQSVKEQKYYFLLISILLVFAVLRGIN